MQETKNDLLQRFRSTTNELIALIESFDPASFNRKPANNGWSAGEVTEHLLIFDKRLTLIIESATHFTERDITEQVGVLTPRVTDRKTPIDAPPFLIPTPGNKSSDELVQDIRTERENILKTLEQKDLALHSKEYPHRFYGEMTVYEWITLIDLHARRHMEQLRELL